MAAAKGLAIVIKKGGVAFAGVQGREIDYKSEPIDITADTNSGWQTYLNKTGVRGYNLSISGVYYDDAFRDLFLGSTDVHMLTDITLLYEDGKTVSCDFVVTGYKESGDSNDAIKFSCEFYSSGIPVVTP